MKDVYLKVLTKLKEVTALKHIDLEKGQMNYERPPVVFPAALVDIQLPKTQNLNHTIQDVQGRIMIRLCFDFTGNTSSETPETVLQQSLDYYDLVEEVYKKFQGWGDEMLNPMGRVNVMTEKRPDAYKVVAIVFTTAWHDYSANS